MLNEKLVTFVSPKYSSGESKITTIGDDPTVSESEIVQK